MNSDPTDEHKNVTGKRRRWLLGLEPIFEGGWLHKGRRAGRWDVEDELIALSLLGDVTVDLAQTRSAPDEIAVNAYAILRDVDVYVAEGTRVELAGRPGNSHQRNDMPVASSHAQPGDPVIRIKGHTVLGDVTVRIADRS